ncbi:MAG: hypothetical protein Q9168_004563 [Polycauliona sp. 1 TL-2023]
MRLTSVMLLGLALVFPVLAQSAKKQPKLCGLAKQPKCSKQEVCIKPAPNVRCSSIDLCPGTCQPSCTLTSDRQPCAYGQKCSALPGFSIQQTGFCPDPVFCGGFGNLKCEGEADGTEKCIDDPRDTCDPKKGGRDCGGICVANTKAPAPEKRICATLSGIQCRAGEKCVDDVENLDCTGGIAADCPGVCVPA